MTSVETLPGRAEGPATVKSADEGAFLHADRVAPAYDGPLFELESMARTVEDLMLTHDRSEEPGARMALFWTTAALVVFVAFFAWLLARP